MKFAEILASYLPSLIVEHVKVHDTTATPPTKQSYNTVVMFADVSGFTALSEAMAAMGPEGAEYLTRHLNSYFAQMVKAIASEGGDIFKFAGDAMIVLWPETEPIEVRARHAVQCALAVQSKLHKAELEKGVTLSVKIGIGVGRVSVLHLGGVLRRMEYVAVGDPLVQSFGAEHHAEAGGEVITSPQIWTLVHKFIRPLEELDDGFVRLTREGKGPKEGSLIGRLPKKSKTAMLSGGGSDGAEEEGRLKSYTPGAIQPWIVPDVPDAEMWGGDLRNVTVLFVNLGLKDHDLLAAAQYDDAMMRVHRTLVAVQSAVYQFEGSVNKFLMDDKGSTLIAVFGLPPLAHEDDAVRGVMSGLAICDKLWDLGLLASVGITTGVVFCGVVGSTTRKEYSVLGDTVNLSARLMQRACKTGGGVLVDLQIQRACRDLVEFRELPEIHVKGKTGTIRNFRPYPAVVDIPLRSTPLNPPGSSPRHFRRIYELQSRRLAKQLSITTWKLDVIPAEEDIINPGDKGDEAAEEKAGAASGGGAAGGGEGGRKSSVLVPGAAAAAAAALSAHGRGGDRYGGLAVTMTTLEVADLTPPFGDQLTERQSANLLLRAPPAYSTATVPPISELILHTQPSATSSLSAPFAPLGTPLEADEATLPTLESLRDAAVDKAKAAGRVRDEEKPQAFVLQACTGTSTLTLPASPLSTFWTCVFALESGAAAASPSLSQLHVRLVRKKELGRLQSRHVAAFDALLHGKMELVGRRQGGVVAIEGMPGVGKSALLRKFVTDTMPHKTSVFVATCHPFKRMAPLEVWGSVLGKFLDQASKEDDEITPLGGDGTATTAKPPKLPKKPLRKAKSVALRQGGKAAAVALGLVDAPESAKAETTEEIRREREEQDRIRRTRSRTAARLLAQHCEHKALGAFGALLNDILNLALPWTAQSDLLRPEKVNAAATALRKRAAALTHTPSPSPSHAGEEGEESKEGAGGEAGGGGGEGVGGQEGAREVERKQLEDQATELVKNAGKARAEIQRQLLFALVKALTANYPAVIVIDAAHVMPNLSWEFALQVAAAACAPSDKGGIPLQLVLSFRPPQWYTDVIFPRVPPALNALVRAPFTKHIRLDRFTLPDAKALIARTVGWRGALSPELLTLIESKAKGNALAIIETLTSLTSKGRLVIASGSNAVDEIGASTECPGLVGTELVLRVGPRPTMRRTKDKSTGGVAPPTKAARLLRAAGPQAGVLCLAHGASTRIPFLRAFHGCNGVVFDRLGTLPKLVLMVGAVIARTTEKLRMAQRNAAHAARAGALAALASTPSATSELPHSSTSGLLLVPASSAALGPNIDADPSFLLSTLRDAFPFEHYHDQLASTCDALVAAGFLRVRAFAVLPGEQPEPRFSFTHPLLAEAVRLRMLAERKKELVKKVEDSLAKRVTKARTVAMKRLLSSPAPGGAGASPLKAALLAVRKNLDDAGTVLPWRSGTREWKQRWVALSGEGLTMFHTPPSSSTPAEDPLQTILLRGANASITTPTDIAGAEGPATVSEHAFVVTAQHWAKKGAEKHEERKFYFAVPSEGDAIEWVFMINYVAQSLGGGGGGEGGAFSGAPPDPKALRKRLRKSTGDDEAFGAAGASGGGKVEEDDVGVSDVQVVRITCEAVMDVAPMTPDEAFTATTTPTTKPASDKKASLSTPSPLRPSTCVVEMGIVKATSHAAAVPQVYQKGKSWPEYRASGVMSEFSEGDSASGEIVEDRGGGAGAGLQHTSATVTVNGDVEDVEKNAWVRVEVLDSNNCAADVTIGVVFIPIHCIPPSDALHKFPPPRQQAPAIVPGPGASAAMSAAKSSVRKPWDDPARGGVTIRVPLFGLGDASRIAASFATSRGHGIEVADWEHGLEDLAGKDAVPMGWVCLRLSRTLPSTPPSLTPIAPSHRPLSPSPSGLLSCVGREDLIGDVDIAEVERMESALVEAGKRRVFRDGEGGSGDSVASLSQSGGESGRVSHARGGRGGEGMGGGGVGGSGAIGYSDVRARRGRSFGGTLEEAVARLDAVLDEDGGANAMAIAQAAADLRAAIHAGGSGTPMPMEDVGVGSGAMSFSAIVSAMDLDESSRAFLEGYVPDPSFIPSSSIAPLSRSSSSFRDPPIVSNGEASRSVGGDAAPPGRKGSGKGPRRHSTLAVSLRGSIAGGREGAGSFKRRPSREIPKEVLRRASSGIREDGGEEEEEKGSVGTSSVGGSTSVEDAVEWVKADASWDHWRCCRELVGYAALSTSEQLASRENHPPTGYGRYGWGLSQLGFEWESVQVVPWHPDERETEFPVDGKNAIEYDSADGELQGPFAATDVWDWYEEDYLEGDMEVRAGSGADPTPLDDIIWGIFVRREVSRVQAVCDFSGDYPKHDPTRWQFDPEVIGAGPDDEGGASLLGAVDLFLLCSLRISHFLPVSEAAIGLFVRGVRESMAPSSVEDASTVPYHTWFHVSDVLQGVVWMLTRGGGSAVLTAVEVMATAVAALGHDMKHPGTNNAFQIATRSEFAITYNDRSVLENMHAAETWRLLDRIDFFALSDPATPSPPTPVINDFRRTIIGTILATDMTEHFGLAERLAAGTRTHAHTLRAAHLRLAASAPSTGSTTPPPASTPSSKPISSTPPDPYCAPALPADVRLVLAQAMLHSSDVGNPTRAWPIPLRWADRVQAEFFLQGDMEKARGMPVTPNFDRASTDQNQFSLNFIDFIVAPLFVALSHAIPGASEPCAALQETRAVWEQRRLDAQALEEASAAESAASSPSKSAAGSGEDDDTSATSPPARRTGDRWSRRASAFHDVLTPISRLSSVGLGDEEDGVGDALTEDEEDDDENSTPPDSVAAHGTISPAASVSDDGRSSEADVHSITEDDEALADVPEAEIEDEDA